MRIEVQNLVQGRGFTPRIELLHVVISLDLPGYISFAIPTFERPGQAYDYESIGWVRLLKHRGGIDHTISFAVRTNVCLLEPTLEALRA